MATLTLPLTVGAKLTRWRFAATIFVGSFLLFLVQPMIARMALPRLGGAPAVWNSAMLVYQALLLFGYAYAHWLGRAPARRQAMIHLGVFAVAGLTLPIGLIAANPPADANAFLWVPWLLLTSIGPLFFVVSAQAPLLQRWFSVSGGGDPYPLYAASNLGSFAGLIAYPLLVEPLLPLAEQRWLWSGAYVLLALLVAWCALTLPRGTQAQEAATAKHPIAWRTVLNWVVLAAVPSGLILSTTLHLTTDLVAMPLLWVAPLGVYLLSFTLAFAARRAAAGAISRSAPIILLIAICGLFLDNNSLDLAFAGVMILNLFTLSVALHSQLFERRPAPEQLTLFYLAMSAGGVIGGIFCALVAPLVFDWTYEHLLLLVAAALLMGTPSLFDRFAPLWNGDKLAGRITLVATILVLLLAVSGKGLFGFPESERVSYYAALAIIAVAIVAIGNRLLFAASVAALIICAGAWEQLALSASPGKMSRSYFGVYSVRSDEVDSRTLVHGTTVHGVQNLGSPARERMATTYYAPTSGVGLAAAAAPALFGSEARIGVVGLGAGTLACYARPGQRWTFYEIDPLIVDIARDPRQFTFLSRCQPDAEVVVGDARLSLQNAPPAGADLLVVDAFSSDSIPMHLLTREAFAAYRRHIGDQGLLLVHISNRYLDLEPVVAASSGDGWHARVRTFELAAADKDRNYTPSIWVALSRDPATLGRLVELSRKEWRPLGRRDAVAPWTDDHASLLSVIRW